MNSKIGKGLYVTTAGKRPQSRVGCGRKMSDRRRSALPHTLDPRSLTLTALMEVTNNYNRIFLSRLQQEEYHDNVHIINVTF